MRSKWPWLFAVAFALFFLSSLVKPGHHAGLFGQDAVAHSRLLATHCEAFPGFDHSRIDYLFAPIGVPLGLMMDSPVMSAAACLWPTENPIARFHFYAALQWLTLWGVLILWARRYLRNLGPAAAFVLAIGFGAFIQVRSLGHYNLFPLAWGTFALWLLLWEPIELKWRNVFVRAGLLALVLLTSIQTLPTFALLILALLTRQILVHPNRKNLLQKMAATLPLVIGLFAFFLGPLIQASLSIELRQDLSTTGRSLFNSDILSYVIPGPFSPLFQTASAALGSFYPAQQGLLENLNSFEPLVLLLLPMIYFERERLLPYLKWLLPLALTYFVFSLGSEIRFGNVVLFQNPLFDLISSLPPFSASRTPGRYATVAIGLLTALAFMGLDHGLTERPVSQTVRRAATGLFILGMGFSVGLLNPRTLQAYTEDYRPLIPEAGLSRMRTEATPGLFAFQVPLALMGDPTQDFLQTFHDRKLVNGYVSYTLMTEKTLSYLNGSPILTALDCAVPMRLDFPRMTANQQALESSAQEIANALKLARIEFVIVNWSLLATPACRPLGEYLATVKSLPPFEIFGETPRFTVLKVR